MKISKKAILVYAFLCNIPVSFFLCLAANLMAHEGQVDWLDFAFNYSISLPIAVLISIFIPLVTIGRKVTKTLGVDNETFTHNISYRLIATFVYTCIFFIILNPTLTLINSMMYHSWKPLAEFLFIWMRGIPLMLIVGFVSSLIFDIPAYKVVHKIDPNF